MILFCFIGQGVFCLASKMNNGKLINREKTNFLLHKHCRCKHKIYCIYSRWAGGQKDHKEPTSEDEVWLEGGQWTMQVLTGEFCRQMQFVIQDALSWVIKSVVNLVLGNSWNSWGKAGRVEPWDSQKDLSIDNEVHSLFRFWAERASF